MGILSFQAEIKEKNRLNNDTIELVLNTSEEFNFKAGQFVTIIFKEEGKKVPRSYSILNPPSEKGKIVLCVKIIPGGFASRKLEEIKEGETLNLKGPLGHFVFSEDQNEEHYLIGAGTGVVPLKSIIKEYLPKRKDLKFTLLFSAKNKEGLLSFEEFKQLEKEYPNFEYKPTLTRQSWEGLEGRVEKHLPLNIKNKTFYICGLKEFVLETKELLLKKGVKPENIKFERYS